MSLAQHERRLRLAHAAQRPAVAVVMADEGGPRADVETLMLVRPGDAAPPAGRPGARRIAVQLAVPGLAIRYLERLLEQAAATGWELECMAAFAAELERRCAYLLAGGGRLPIQPRAGASRRRRSQAALWHAGGWVAGARPEHLAVRLVAGARARDDALLAASSGTLQGRCARKLTAQLEQEGVTIRNAGARAVARSGGAWAIEVLAVPRLAAEHLGALRERFAGAPRCEWCGLPVIGAACRRCASGVLR